VRRAYPRRYPTSGLNQSPSPPRDHLSSFSFENSIKENVTQTFFQKKMKRFKKKLCGRNKKIANKNRQTNVKNITNNFKIR
jgi:hypothetical protein